MRSGGSFYRSSLVAPALMSFGGALLVASVFGPVASHGIGSVVSARQFADLLLGGAVEAWAPRWAGLALYLHPICGAALLLGSGVGGRLGPKIVLGGLVVSAAGQALMIVALGGRPLTSPGWGAMAVYGGLVASGTSFVLARAALRVQQS